MDTEAGRLLEQVVAEVFDADVQATFSTHPRSKYVRRAELAVDGQRIAGLRISPGGWADVTIFDLGVSATVDLCNEEEAEQKAVLRDLAVLARAFMRGEGQVVYKRGLFGRCPVLTITVDGRECQLGRTVSRVPPRV